MTFLNWMNLKQMSDIIGYNIVGDGTPAALLPILTGQTELELPESRHNHAGADTVDRFPWIWNKFKGMRVTKRKP
jgi:hypothetical protein